MAARTTSIRVEHNTLERLDRLARSMDRTRSWVVSQAIEQYLEYEDWFVAEVEKGIAAADRSDLIPHADVLGEARRRISNSRKDAR